MQIALACLLACAIPIAGAQSPQDLNRFYDNQRNERLQAAEVAHKLQENKLNLEAAENSLAVHLDRNREVAGGPSGGDASVLAPLALLAVVAGFFVLWGKQPERRYPPEFYERQTRFEREGLIYRQCKAGRQAGLMVPRYEKPNSWALMRMFQSDRAAEFQEAMKRYEKALAEMEPTCRCVAAQATAAAGFSEAEWHRIAEHGARERPWLALDTARVQGLFAGCAARSPSDGQMSWLYAAAKP
jgi:hypothetical protein